MFYEAWKQGIRGEGQNCNIKCGESEFETKQSDIWKTMEELEQQWEGQILERHSIEGKNTMLNYRMEFWSPTLMVQPEICKFTSQCSIHWNCTIHHAVLDLACLLAAAAFQASYLQMFSNPMYSCRVILWIMLEMPTPPADFRACVGFKTMCPRCFAVTGGRENQYLEKTHWRRSSWTIWRR